MSSCGRCDSFLQSGSCSLGVRNLHQRQEGSKQLLHHSVDLFIYIHELLITSITIFRPYIGIMVYLRKKHHTDRTSRAQGECEQAAGLRATTMKAVSVQLAAIPPPPTVRHISVHHSICEVTCSKGATLASPRFHSTSPNACSIARFALAQETPSNTA